MINPYTCYILGFFVSFLVYQFGWSELYPRLSNALLLFLAGTLIVHFMLSRKWSKLQIKNRNEENFSEPQINPWGVTVFLYCLWAADFINEGGIPLIKVLFNIPYDYKKFGVPSLHVFVVTFSSFYSVYLFYIYLKTKRKEIFLIYMINMSAAILIYSRSMLFFNLASCFFLYLLSLEKIPYKKLLLGIPALFLVFYFFGVVGTKRVSFESRQPYNPKLFLDNGKATSQFRESTIPKEFFWAYFYISSPMANLQTNINTYAVKPITASRILEYVNNELLFESISKRINAVVGVEREDENTIQDPFNVSTIYSRSYSYLGWIGIIITALVVLALPLGYNRIIDNQYNLVALAILCTTYLFLTYDNTIRLMALGFQLVYPVLMPIVDKRLQRKNIDNI